MSLLNNAARIHVYRYNRPNYFVLKAANLTLSRYCNLLCVFIFDPFKKNSVADIHGEDNEVTVQTESAASASAIAMQMMISLQQLDSKVTLLGSNLESKLVNLNIRLDAVKDRLEDKVLSVQDDVESFKDVIEDKIETRVVDKLCQLDIKMSTAGGNVKDPEGEKPNETNGCLASLEKEFRQGQREILSSTSALAERTEDMLNNTNIAISVLQENLTSHLACQRKDQDRFNNLMAAVQEISNISKDLRKQVDDDFSQLNDSVQKLAQIIKSVEGNSESMLSSMSDFIATVDSSIADGVKTTMDHIFNPKHCQRGMYSALVDAKFPYPVIRASKGSSLEVPHLCDTVTEGGGWIIIQRRASGNTDFYRDWDAYKGGFGTLDDDFWLGNDNIHVLTSSAKYELRIELKYNGKAAFAHYSSFSISDEDDKYKLSLGEYDGTAGDSLDYHRGRPFSTRDMDNDGHGSHCAQQYTGAWWYGNCHNANLNGQWQAGEGLGPRWRQFSQKEPVTFSEMKIRRVEQ